MKQKILNTLPIFLILFVLFLVPTLLHAQPDNPGADPAPIDGGASIVAVACAGYLVKRKKNRN